VVSGRLILCSGSWLLAVPGRLFGHHGQVEYEGKTVLIALPRKHG
jgi:hypothetical protein